MKTRLIEFILKSFDALLLFIVLIRGTVAFGFYHYTNPSAKKIEFHKTLESEKISEDVRGYVFGLFELFIPVLPYILYFEINKRVVLNQLKWALYKNIAPSSLVSIAEKKSINGVSWKEAKEYSDFAIANQYQFKHDTKEEVPTANACLYILYSEFMLNMERSIDVDEAEWKEIKNMLKFKFPFLVTIEKNKIEKKISNLLVSDYSVDEKGYVGSWREKIKNTEIAVKLAQTNKKYTVTGYLKGLINSFEKKQKMAIV